MIGRIVCITFAVFMFGYSILAGVQTMLTSPDHHTPDVDGWWIIAGFIAAGVVLAIGTKE